MNDERDPKLEALFQESVPEDLSNDFTDKVMTGVENRHRNLVIGRVAIVALPGGWPVRM